ncbi:MAG: hypothetical protein ACI9ON_004323 [Limisphaerales bacterium]|jgi:hypothetical protein
MKYVLPLLLLSVSGAVFGQDGTSEENCALIENARERLVCYDRTFPIGVRAELPKISSEVIAPAQSPESQTLEGQSLNTAPASADEAQAPVTAVEDTSGLRARKGTTASPAAGKNRTKGMFSWDDELDFTAEVKAVRDEGQQRMVFLLDNEQIWMQSSPRLLPIKKGDSVRVKSGKIGGYIMRNQNGTSTRVNRIK